MDDKKSQEATKGEVAEEKSEALIAQEVPFVEKLDEAVGQSVEQFYKDLLVKADERIRAQEEQLKQLSRQQLEFRDEIAMRCYTILIPVISDYPKAANSAYQAADAFLRARESGFLITTLEEEKEKEDN